MKSIKIPFIIILGFFVLMASCDKTDKDLILENADWRPIDRGGVAFLRVFDAYAANTPNLPGSSTAGPVVFLYGNAVKFTHTGFGYGSAWPSTSVYATVPAGPTAFDVVMSRMNTATPQQPAPNAGDTLLKFNYSTVAGRYYSLFLVDTTTMRFLMIDDAPIFPPDGKYRIRLVHVAANPKDTLNLYSRLEKRNIIVNIPHKQYSDWLERDVILDTLEVRKNGQAVATYVWSGTTTYTPFNPVSKRFYTVVARGKDGLTGKGPGATLITNY